MTHMESLAASSTNADIQGRGRKVSRDMRDLRFVVFSHFLADLLGELAKLSLQLQKSDLTLPAAINTVDE